MILVRKYSGGSMSFRTSTGSVDAKLKDGFLYVDVEGNLSKQMQMVHKFHAPPSSFSLEKPKKEIIVEQPKRLLLKEQQKKEVKKLLNIK